MKLIYIAGPYRAENPWLVEQNIRRAEAYILPIAEMGAATLCPHPMTRYLNGTMTDEYWLEATMEMLRRCDAVFLAPEWYDSVGTRGELVTARELGLPIFCFLETLKSWLEKEEARNANI